MEELGQEQGQDRGKMASVKNKEIGDDHGSHGNKTSEKKIKRTNKVNKGKSPALKTGTGTCDVCCDKYTNHDRKPVVCVKCDKSACLSCVKKYVTSVVDDPHCIFCKNYWSQEFLDEIFTIHFRSNKYRMHRENVLCEREKSHLPETQALYYLVKERQGNLQSEIKLTKKKSQDLHQELEAIIIDYNERMVNLNQLSNEMHRQIIIMNSVLEGYIDDIPDDNTLKRDAVNKSIKINLGCPNELCNGFLDEHFTCMICKISICSDCHVILKNGTSSDIHECSEVDVATIRSIIKDSKSCPGCSSMIHKIDGCDQMWCTRCHTSFSWNSGEKIVKGQIHNPHFYAWRRGNGGLAPGAVDRNGKPIGIVEPVVLSNHICILTKKKSPSMLLMKLRREVIHIQEQDNHNRDIDMVDPTRLLRIQYLTCQINLEQWKSELHAKEKKDKHTLETRRVLETYTTVVEDVFRKIMDADTKETLSEIQNELVLFMEYIFANLCKINQRYGSTALPVWSRLAPDFKRLTAFCL